jgi:short-subunit dehydrogenase
MRVCLVTGASTGIGEATAIRLAREPGTELVLVARREELLRKVAESLPCKATCLAVDLTTDEAPERVRAHVESEHGRLDLLVNNAGAAWRGGFAESGYANVQRHMELNFDAVVRLTEALLPLLRGSAPSAIVNVASTAGRVSRARTGAYSASKFALIGWTDALYAEELPHGVHVGMVLPGYVHRGLPGHRAAPESDHPLGGVEAREGRRGDLRSRSWGQGRALRAASLRVGRGGAHPDAAAGPARPHRWRRSQPHDQHRGGTRRGQVRLLGGQDAALL